mmetsp:Transcript_99044/g.174728  ORF Transcript_99044/g.174728 Transcript_99044/m.174728 type:complete len:214 (-) Transcript_99044:145-786(-)
MAHRGVLPLAVVGPTLRILRQSGIPCHLWCLVPSAQLVVFLQRTHQVAGNLAWGRWCRRRSRRRRRCWRRRSCVATELSSGALATRRSCVTPASSIQLALIRSIPSACTCWSAAVASTEVSTMGRATCCGAEAVARTFHIVLVVLVAVLSDESRWQETVCVRGAVLQDSLEDWSHDEVWKPVVLYLRAHLQHLHIVCLALLIARCTLLGCSQS